MIKFDELGKICFLLCKDFYIKFRVDIRHGCSKFYFAVSMNKYLRGLSGISSRRYSKFINIHITFLIYLSLLK